jgi:hypothetical protein
LKGKGLTEKSQPFYSWQAYTTSATQKKKQKEFGTVHKTIVPSSNIEMLICQG